MADNRKKMARSEIAQRKTVFLFGFGLRMSPEDVSDFLTKVLLEADFNFSDPTEIIFWHCYQNHLPYLKAQELLYLYQKMQPQDLHDFAKEENVEDQLNERNWDIKFDIVYKNTFS